LELGDIRPLYTVPPVVRTDRDVPLPGGRTYGHRRPQPIEVKETAHEPAGIRATTRFSVASYGTPQRQRFI
jgi:hypothetical protein